MCFFLLLFLCVCDINAVEINDVVVYACTELTSRPNGHQSPMIESVLLLYCYFV